MALRRASSWTLRYHRTATNWFNNGFVLEDRPVSCQMSFTYRIYGNGRSDNRLRRFRHLIGHHNILFLPPKWKWACHIQQITRADFVQAKVFRSRSMNTHPSEQITGKLAYASFRCLWGIPINSNDTISFTNAARMIPSPANLLSQILPINRHWCVNVIASLDIVSPQMWPYLSGRALDNLISSRWNQARLRRNNATGEDSLVVWRKSSSYRHYYVIIRFVGGCYVPVDACISTLHTHRHTHTRARARARARTHTHM